MVCKHIILSGRVQGVGFRYHTQQEAIKLGLKGYVQNLKDGRVEIVVCGELPQVEELTSWVQKGPPGSQVKDYLIKDLQDCACDETFHIRREKESM